jgi:hypothetical protein
MTRRSGLIGLLALVFCTAFGQTWCGTVVSSAGRQPLENATVSLLASDSLLVSYIYTNVRGEFCITPPPGRAAAYLSVSYIGFRTEQIPLGEYRDGIRFEMKPADVALREVKVNANRIRLGGDTLIYHVAGFKTPQDRTVRDVLSRIPGIGVSDEGDISYLGEKINVFYIEGLDLLGDKYKLASNNMRANYVKEIQVLENHVPVKSLAGKTFSEQAALNLILEDHARGEWLGAFDLGAGAAPFKWSNRITGMRFDKRGQQLNLYKNDNTGENLLSEIQSAQGVAQITESRHNDPWLNPVLDAGTLPAPPIESKRHRMNSEHLLATNQLYKLDDDAHLRIQLSYLDNTLTSENHTRWVYHLPGSAFTINEDVRQKERQHHLEAGINYTRNSSASYLTDHLKATARFDKTSLDVYANHSPLRQQYDLPSLRVSNDFAWVAPREGYRWEAASSLIFDHAPDELLIEAEQALVWSDSITRIREKINARNFIMRNNVQHVLTLRRFSFYQKAGIDVIHQRLQSETAPALPMLEGRPFGDEASYASVDCYYEPRLQYMAGKLSLNASATLSAKRFRLESSASEEDDFDFALLPRLNALYEAGWWTLRGRIALDSRYNPLQTIYPGWIASNYRRLLSGETTFRSFVSDSYTLSVAYRNPVTSFFFSLSAAYHFDHYRHIRQNDYINELISVTQVLKYKHTQPGQLYMLNAAKSFATWNTRLFVDATYARTQSNNITGSTFTSSENQNLSLSARLFAQPLRWFNAQYEMQAAFARFGILKPTAHVYPAMVHVAHKLNTYFVRGKSWQMGVNHHIYHGDAMPEASYFADITVIFRWNNKEVSLLVSNLFNNAAHYYSTYQAYREYQTRHTLSGRYALARLSFAL